MALKDEEILHAFKDLEAAYNTLNKRLSAAIWINRFVVSELQDVVSPAFRNALSDKLTAVATDAPDLPAAFRAEIDAMRAVLRSGGQPSPTPPTKTAPDLRLVLGGLHKPKDSTN